MAEVKSEQSGIQANADVHITYEDQQKINKFARQNARLQDLKEELRIKQNELKNLQDAVDELICVDDDAKIPYYVGEVFVYQNLEKTLNCLEDAMKKKNEEIANLKSRCTDLKSVMSELKTQLYAKLGSHINLEDEED